MIVWQGLRLLFCVEELSNSLLTREKINLKILVESKQKQNCATTSVEKKVTLESNVEKDNKEKLQHWEGNYYHTYREKNRSTSTNGTRTRSTGSDGEPRVGHYRPGGAKESEESSLNGRHSHKHR